MILQVQVEGRNDIDTQRMKNETRQMISKHLKLLLKVSDILRADAYNMNPEGIE